MINEVLLLLCNATSAATGTQHESETTWPIWPIVKRWFAFKQTHKCAHTCTRIMPSLSWWKPHFVPNQPSLSLSLFFSLSLSHTHKDMTPANTRIFPLYILYPSFTLAAGTQASVRIQSMYEWDSLISFISPSFSAHCPCYTADHIWDQNNKTFSCCMCQNCSNKIVKLIEEVSKANKGF